MNQVGRRRFLRSTVPAGLAAPLFLQGRAGKGYGQESPARKTKAKIRMIAIEEHWSGAEFAGMPAPKDWLIATRLGTTPERTRRLKDLAELRLADMDRAGIAVQVIGTTSVQAIADVSLAIDVAKRSNDQLAELMHKHPDRFAGFAAVPTQAPQAAAAELERAVTRLGFKGAMVGGRANGEWLDDDRFQVLWECSAALAAPIYIHPADPSPEIMKMYDGCPVLLGNTWAWGVETATHALRLIASGIFDAYPKAEIILGHVGESLPFLLGRFDEGLSSVKPEIKGLKKPFSSYVKENILVTTSGWYQPEALVCTISALGADRILFADDYPWVDTELAIRMFENTPMSDANREKIYHRNAERWLKLA